MTISICKHSFIQLYETRHVPAVPLIALSNHRMTSYSEYTIRKLYEQEK
jgi:hypothetical protein